MTTPSKKPSSKTAIDRLFMTPYEGLFRFDEEVTHLFEDMLQRSIPYYEEVVRMTAELLDDWIGEEGGLIYDLGCSYGRLFKEVIQRHPQRFLKLVGVDSSRPMINKAKKYTSHLPFAGTLHWECKALEDITWEPCHAVVLNYTLQFIKYAEREALLSRLHKALVPGGRLILSEKVFSRSDDLQKCFTRHYEDFKGRNGYSPLEIARKKEALKQVLVPVTWEHNRALLNRAGFEQVEIFFKWYQFVSLVAIKS